MARTDQGAGDLPLDGTTRSCCWGLRERAKPIGHEPWSRGNPAIKMFNSSPRPHWWGCWQSPWRQAVDDLIASKIADHRRARLSSLLGQCRSPVLQLVSRRYEKGSILITSNRSVGEWRNVFGDPVVATAIQSGSLLRRSLALNVTLSRSSMPTRIRCSGCCAAGAAKKPGVESGASR